MILEFTDNIRLALRAPAIVVIAAWGFAYMTGPTGFWMFALASAIACLVELIAIPVAMVALWRDHKADVLKNYLAIATGILPLLNFAFVALIAYSMGRSA